MQANRSNAGALVGGALLILVGLMTLASQIFNFVNWWSSFWPFIVIGFGALFFVAMFASGKQTAGLAIPGSIISGIGLILLFQNLTHHWESMSYFWTGIVFFVGLGIYIMGLYDGSEHRKQAGLRVMKVGFFLFIIFGAFFEMIFASFIPDSWRGIIFPVLLILLGGYLVLTRAGLFSTKKEEASPSSDTTLPPAS
ncbi:MAG TPA: hypothetical protein VMT73_11150 [Anaerolineales bacterium]|nr:hypothetical protein [Anaerolineales bacterium]